jgi:hypothetical protein
MIQPAPLPDVYFATEKGRFGLLYFSIENIVWMCSGRLDVVANLLPQDVLIVRFFADEESKRVVVVLTSSEFAEVERGLELPKLPPITITRVIRDPLPCEYLPVSPSP